MLKTTLLFILMSFIALAHAQQGTIRGTVIDNNTGETIIGANVILKGTSTGTSTDLDGKFSLKVDEGTHSLQITFISFATTTMDDITVKSDEVTQLGEIRLKTASIEIDAVVITAKQSRNNEAAMATIQKKSINVMDGVSSQTFKKSGDSDAGSAIKRVTGVSVEGGKYVYVRGLGDRYTKTTLNGMEVPGLDPDRNSIQLDIFPTNLIDNISVFKSFSPELAGDFTGGVVDIVTKDFPEEKNASISASLGFTPGMNLVNDFRSYESTNQDRIALGANDRDVPFDRNIQLLQSDNILNPEKATNFTRKFNPDLATTQINSFVNAGIGFNMGNQINKDKATYGYNFAISYDRSFQYYEDVEYSEYITNRETDKFALIKARQDSGEVGIEEVFWSVYGSGSVKLKNTSVSLGLMRLQNGSKQSSLLEGFKSSLGSDQEAVLQKHILYYNERSITNLLLSARQYFPKQKLEIKFRAAPTLSQNKEPDFRQTVYNIEDENIFISGGGLPVFQRLYRDLEEWSFGNRLDAKWEYKQWSGQKSALKAGAAFTYKFRTFDILTYQFREISRRDDYTLDPNELLVPSNIFDVNSNPNGVVAQGFEQPNNNYESVSTNFAYYLQNEMPITSTLKTVLGVRVESFDIFYTGERQVVLTDADVFDNDNVLSELNVLPSVGIIYNFMEDVNLRFNYSQTVARPSFKEKSAAEIIDALTGRIFIGNLDVEQTEISNYDLRIEKFFKGGQLISLSGFYKEFTNPIEIVAFDQTATNQFTPRNSSDATVYGLEFDARRNLSFLKENLDKWSAGLNFTYVVSQIDRTKIITPGEDGVMGTADDISEFDERVLNARDGETIEKFRSLQGQSPYVINGYLNYRNDSLGLECNLSYNVQGKALAFVGISNSPNVYSQPFHSLNFKASKTLGKDDRLNMSLKVTNILGDVRESFFESFQSDDQVFSRIAPLRTISIGASYKL